MALDFREFVISFTLLSATGIAMIPAIMGTSHLPPLLAWGATVAAIYTLYAFAVGSMIDCERDRDLIAELHPWARQTD
jgi:hypothetical protein